MGNAILKLMATSQEGAAGGGTGRADMEIREPHAFRVQPVEVGGLQHRMAVGGDVTVALVVGENENDVGPLAGNRRARADAGRGRPKGRNQDQNREKSPCLTANFRDPPDAWPLENAHGHVNSADVAPTPPG